MHRNAKRKSYRKYSDIQLADAVMQYLQGDGTISLRKLSNVTSLPYKTIHDYVLRFRNGSELKQLPLGPPPLLTSAVEIDLVDWIRARQVNNIPVNRSEIMKTANSLKRVIETCIPDSVTQRYHDVDDPFEIHEADFEPFGKNGFLDL
ncbi:MAG: hypothetical protein FD122_3699 [Stygiobacter sp.]|nr:MAG: hypothetical protein FD122_3699 [Stygiobacter sp.]